MVSTGSNSVDQPLRAYIIIFSHRSCNIVYFVSLGSRCMRVRVCMYVYTYTYVSYTRRIRYIMLKHKLTLRKIVTLRELHT